jgi:DnaK suppressor protein
MTNPIARRLRSDLAATLARLRLLDGDGGDSLAPTGDATNLVDSAQAVELRELGNLAATRLIDRARRLRAALERFEDGGYGVCEECGEDIPRRRLAALPDAATCLCCQQRRELAPLEAGTRGLPPRSRRR